MHPDIFRGLPRPRSGFFDLLRHRKEVEMTIWRSLTGMVAVLVACSGAIAAEEGASTPSTAPRMADWTQPLNGIWQFTTPDTHETLPIPVPELWSSAFKALTPDGHE